MQITSKKTLCKLMIWLRKANNRQIYGLETPQQK
jgi:hypothetical protein